MNPFRPALERLPAGGVVRRAARGAAQRARRAARLPRPGRHTRAARDARRLSRPGARRARRPRADHGDKRAAPWHRAAVVDPRRGRRPAGRGRGPRLERRTRNRLRGRAASSCPSRSTTMAWSSSAWHGTSTPSPSRPRTSTRPAPSSPRPVAPRCVAWAQRRGALIVEDDYDAEYRYDRQPIGSLQGLAPERVVTAARRARPSPQRSVSAGSSSRAPRAPIAVAPAPARRDARAAAAARARRPDRARRARPPPAPPAPALPRQRDALLAALAGQLPEVTVHGAAAGLYVVWASPRASASRPCSPPRARAASPWRASPRAPRARCRLRQPHRRRRRTSGGRARGKHRAGHRRGRNLRRMARPRLELGTPRFLGIPRLALKAAHL